MWNHSDTQGPRTNNHSEGDHVKFNRELSKAHPNIYAFIIYFKKIESKIDTNFHKINLGQTLKKSKKFYIEQDKKIFELTTQRRKKSIDLWDF